MASGVSKRPVWRTVCAFAWLACVLMVLSGCGGSPTPPALTGNNQDPHWVYRSEPPSRVAIVFVHGLFGDTTQTWTHDSGTTFFGLVREHPKIDHRADIFAFGFTSKMFGSGSLNVREAATALDEWFQLSGIWDYDHVVLAAHSMGGLVTMRHLVNNRQRLAKVPLILLYATPTDGADIANIASHVAGNPALAQMLNDDNNEFLATLNEDWVRIPQNERPMVRCAYETANTGPVMVVQRRSAVRYCDGNLVAVGGSNHINIVKPDRAEHLSVVMFVNALEQVVLRRDADITASVPDFTENAAGEWVFHYRAASRNNRASVLNTGMIPLRYHIGAPSDDKLLLTPRPTPRAIPVSGREDIEFYLTSLGEPRPEYTFSLRIEPMGERVVRVKLDDPQALIERQSSDLAIAADAMSRYVAAHSERLATLTPDQQELQIADAARVALAATYDDIPEDRQWLITSDLLAATPMSSAAAAALRNVEALTPEIMDAPAIRGIATDLHRRTGKPVLDFQQNLDTPGGPITTFPDEASLRDRETLFDRQDRKAWSDLAIAMEKVPSQRYDGLILQGDLHVLEGREQRAADAYLRATQIAETPELRNRIDRVGRNPRDRPQQR